MLRPIFQIFTLLLLAFAFSACTQKSNLPDEERFSKDTTMMYDMSHKFSEETDAKKLRSVVMATQHLHMFTCTGDFQKSCDKYNDFLKLVMDVTEDASISVEERVQMRNEVEALRQIIFTEKNDLHAAHAKK